MAVDRMLTPSGRPYAPGTVMAKVYVLKESDEWLADESETGAIWSGGLGKIKSNQHPRRFILDQNGTVLRPPLAGPGVVPPAGISADAVKAARAIGRLQIGDSLRQYLLRSLIRQITPDQPAFTTRAARVAGVKTHGDHVVMCWVTAMHISRKGADVEGFLHVGTVTCRVTPEQHAEITNLRSKPRMVDLPDTMRAAGSPEQLLELGWERYRRAGIKTYKAGSTARDL